MLRSRGFEKIDQGLWTPVEIGQWRQEFAKSRGIALSRELNLPGSEMPVIDESRLMTEFGGDKEILSELRDLFLEHATLLYKAMKEAVANGDCEMVAREAHSFKGACATYGAPRLAMVCREFEILAKEKDIPTARANIAHLEMEYHAVFEAIGTIDVS